MSTPVYGPETRYDYANSDFAFDMFLATVAPSDFSEYEWRLFQTEKRNINPKGKAA